MARPRNDARDDGAADYLNDAQCAARFGVSRETWKRWTRDGTAPTGIKFARGTVRWRRAKLDEWAASRPEAGSAA